MLTLFLCYLGKEIVVQQEIPTVDPPSVIQPASFKFVVPKERRFRGHINVYSKPALIKVLKNGLSPDDWVSLIDGCLGPIVRAGDHLYFYHQLVHQMLLHEVETSQVNEMWFQVGQHLFRFSLAEFCCVTGLSWKEPGDDMSPSPHVDMEEFLGVRNCTFIGLLQIFLKEPTQSPKKLSMAYLLLIEGVLLPQRSKALVRQSFVDLVCDFDRLKLYPFGRVVFLETLGFLKKSMRSDQSKKGPRFGYNLLGYPVAFQVFPWPFLLCPNAFFFFLLFFTSISVLNVALFSGLDFRGNP